MNWEKEKFDCGLFHQTAGTDKMQWNCNRRAASQTETRTWCLFSKCRACYNRAMNVSRFPALACESCSPVIRLHVTQASEKLPHNYGECTLLCQVEITLVHLSISKHMAATSQQNRTKDPVFPSHMARARNDICACANISHKM
jgi:hypothetical protein